MSPFFLTPPCSILTTPQGDVSITSPSLRTWRPLIFVRLGLNPQTYFQRQRSNRTPQIFEKAVVCNWCETMQGSGVSYRLCRASFIVRASAHLRCAEFKQMGMLGLNFVTSSETIVQLSLLHHTTATACLGMECTNDSALIS